MNMIFILSHDVFVASPLMKYIFFHFTRWIKSHIYEKTKKQKTKIEYPLSIDCPNLLRNLVV